MKKLIFVLFAVISFMSLGINANAQSKDKSTVEKVVNDYFDALNSSDANKVVAWQILSGFFVYNGLQYCNHCKLCNIATVANFHWVNIFLPLNSNWNYSKALLYYRYILAAYKTKKFYEQETKISYYIHENL